MLVALEIENFAIINKMRLELQNGLNVLTGETGAGKSIVIDAVKLLLGGRAGGDWIRTGADKAIISGFFVVDCDELSSLLQELGIDQEEDSSMLLQRVLNINGKNICRINGRQVTLSMYRQVGANLIDIYGQHDHHSLMNADNHLELLDLFGGEELMDLKSQVGQAYTSMNKIKNSIAKLQANQREHLQQLDLWKFQLEEIDQSELQAGEEELLRQERQILANSEKLQTGVEGAYEALTGGSENARGLIAEGISELSKVSELDQSLNQLQETLESSLYQLEDVTQELRRYSDQVSHDPQRLLEVDNRLQLIKLLKRKYGADIAEVLLYGEKLRENISQVEDEDQLLPDLEEQFVKLEQEYIQLAAELTSLREQVGAKLQQGMTRELIDLEMKHTVFQVSFTQLSQHSKNGQEQGEFLLSANPGEPVKALDKIASGGELSRIMLALKSMLAAIDGVPTLIFDEIDTGIGGQTVQSVAEKLAQISKVRQVICVTHSAQIAGRADCHQFLTKELIAERMETKVIQLSEQERIEEVARMLAGNKVTDTTIQQAKEIIGI